MLGTDCFARWKQSKFFCPPLLPHLPITSCLIPTPCWRGRPTPCGSPAERKLKIAPVCGSVGEGPVKRQVTRSTRWFSQRLWRCACKEWLISYLPGKTSSAVLACLLLSHRVCCAWGAGGPDWSANLFIQLIFSFRFLLHYAASKLDPSYDLKHSVRSMTWVALTTQLQ